MLNGSLETYATTRVIVVKGAKFVNFKKISGMTTIHYFKALLRKYFSILLCIQLVWVSYNLY